MQFKKLIPIIILIFIFFSAIVIWYSPVFFKGYSSQTIHQDILLARNYHQTGILATHNNQSVVVSSNLIKEEGRPLVMSQYLRSFFYAKIFDVIGIPDHNNLILISITLYALTLVFFTVLILYLFNFKIAIVFSLIYIFSPLGWGLIDLLGNYEFCLIFWSLFFIFYFLAVKKYEKKQNKFAILLFIISGIFLAFSVLTKEIVFVFVLAFFIFLFIKKFRQQLIYIFVPFVILLIIFWLPSVLTGKNSYIPTLINRPTEEFTSLAKLHVFPDAYTYYFEREEFLEEFRNQDFGFSENLETRKILANFGFSKISIFDRFKIGTYLLSGHLFRFFSLEDFGGPFITLLLILGMIYLRKKDKFLSDLSFYWLIISFLVFSFFVLAGRNHLMDFIWLLILFVALGLVYLFDIIKNHFKLEEKKAELFGIIMIGLLLYHLVLVNHVLLGRQYDKDSVPRSMAYAQEIKNLEIQDRDTIAIPGDFPSQETTLNYLTDKSFIIFRSSTLSKLLKEDKAKQALEAFGVKYILGYSDELSKELVEKAGTTNIASNSLKIDIEEASQNKSFLMNLVR